MIGNDKINEQIEAWRHDLRDASIAEPSQEVFERLPKVWEASQYVMRSCQLDLHLLPRLAESGQLSEPLEAGRIERLLLEKLADVYQEQQLASLLRQFRREQMVRIIWRDITGWAQLDETLEDLSALADVCIQQGCKHLYAWQETESGTPLNELGEPQPLLVLGMGKLGARELNLSSDIDLIFVYPDSGQTNGPRPLSNESFFIRLCQRLVRLLDEKTADGFVFRVDTRLRPFGSVGPLAMKFEALESYYASQARDWERYAMIKARVVACTPDDPDGRYQQGLMDMLRPFVYRRYLDYGAFESLRIMKSMISKELYKKGMDANIKLGRGGIREIEFIGQAFQLIRGGRNKDLQVRGIQQVLGLLAKHKLMSETATEELKSAYRFLRLTENRLQAWADQQTHLLPSDEEGRLRLARSMNFSDWDRFSQTLELHRDRVQSHFDELIANPFGEDSADSHELSEIWRDSPESEAAQVLLSKYGFDEPQILLRVLDEFRQSHACRMLSQRGRARLDQLMPLLLETIGREDNRAETIRRVFALLEAITRRSVYVALLVENPVALRQLVLLCGKSQWIARLLQRQPVLLDELLDPRRLYAPLKRAELDSELCYQLVNLDADDLEQIMERLRQFCQSNQLRVAAADITENIPLMVVSDYLTDIAECVTQYVVDLAWRDLVKRHGSPCGLKEGEKGFGVISYGKLGGIEMGYGSDLDVVFVHGIESASTMTDGDKPVSTDVFYARLGQRIIHLFSTRTPSGILYELDMRLRPNGNSGMLVSSLKALENYQLNNAWTWEHQALIRARMVVGDDFIRTRFAEIRERVIRQPRDDHQLRSEVIEMREKMRASLDKSKPGWFDLKQGVGGIVDIEFMVQYCVLRWVDQYPELLQWTDNIRLLETLERTGKFSGEFRQQLMEAYKALRAAYHRQALNNESYLMDDGVLQNHRRAVQAAWQELLHPADE